MADFMNIDFESMNTFYGDSQPTEYETIYIDLTEVSDDTEDDEEIIDLALYPCYYCDTVIHGSDDLKIFACCDESYACGSCYLNNDFLECRYCGGTKWF